MNRRKLKPLMLLVALGLVAVAPALYAASQSVQIPPPEYQDIAEHNKGNIRTTIANWGLVGGLGHYGYPSGEWPNGSGHNYLAEIKYWMGATLAGGDTALANSDDDFLPEISLSTANEYGISISTDPETY
ncbi:MAG: hypothetical protein KAT58_01060, partial [candidate division Zixibacteria bacterium]|nr:hypothetical protein [candidate division Zixibacteria bacterium]